MKCVKIIFWLEIWVSREVKLDVMPLGRAL